MPRRGKFGRRRGGSTNLTALVAQLLKEQRAAEDRVMFDAWQNGGQVDGKAVTDDRLLKYIKGRRDGFSKDDPLWDEWDNRLTQYGFSIGESKITLAFQQGKVGAGAVAAFYRGQLSKIDKNSEFYRDVAGRAAQWAKAVGGAARGRARGRATSGLRDRLNNLIHEGARYDALERALTEYARREGIITGDQKLTDAKAQDLRAMFDRGLYSGNDRITFEDFREAAVGKFKNLSKQVDLQIQLGNQGITARNAKQRFLEETLVGLNTIDERSQYEAVRESWEGEIARAQGNPYAIAGINQRYATALARIRDNAAQVTSGYSQNSAEFIGALQNEIGALTTGTAQGVTVAEIFGATGDMADTAASTQALNAAMKDIRAGKAYYGQTEPGGPLSVVAFEPGVADNPLGLDPSLQPSVSNIGGIPQTVYLKGDEVRASIIVDSSGRPVEGLPPEGIRAGLADGTLTLEEGDRLGYVFVNPATGLKKYGVIDPTSGNMVFTSENPWAADPINNGESLIILTDGVRQGDRYVPNAATLFRNGVGPDLATADPLLADTTVAPRDMLALLEAGIPGVNFQPEDVEDYKAKLLQRQQAEQAAIANRYKGQSYNNLGHMGEVPADHYGPQGGGDLRSSILSGMNQIGNVTTQLFGSPDRQKDDLYVPPPPAPPPAPALPPEIEALRDDPEGQADYLGDQLGDLGDAFGDFGDSLKDKIDPITPDKPTTIVRPGGSGMA
jgi:hypothetical protein